MVSTLGWVGALGTVSAYALVSRRRLDASSMRFQATNALGAVLLGLSAMSHGNWAAAAANVLWAFFGVQALVSARHLWRPGATRRWHSVRRWTGRVRQSLSSTTQQLAGVGRSRAV